MLQTLLNKPIGEILFYLGYYILALVVMALASAAVFNLAFSSSLKGKSVVTCIKEWHIAHPYKFTVGLSIILTILLVAYSTYYE